MEPVTAADPAATRIAAAVEASLDESVSAAAEAIWEQVPAYQGSSDQQLRAEVTGHVRAIFLVFLVGLTGRPARRADFAMTRQQATRRADQGITLADFLHAFRIGQLTLWHGVLAAAGDDPEARDAALAIVAQIMQVIGLGSTVAAEAYVEAQQHAVAETDRVRRDLLEDLLARRSPLAGRKRSLLRAAGLGPDTSLLVATAVLAGDRSDDRILRESALTVSRPHGRGRGLAVVRQDEIVIVLPLPRGGASVAVTGLQRVCADLRQRRIRLAMGVSTVRTGLGEIADAYTEACVARDGLGTTGGVLTLPLLTSFDYLMLRDDETAAPDLAAGAPVRYRGRRGGWRADRYFAGVCRLRPQRQDRGGTAAPARQHGVLPAGTDRRANRLRPAAAGRRDGVAHRGAATGPGPTPSWPAVHSAVISGC